MRLWPRFQEFLGHAGPQVIEPLGVLSGMIFAAMTRASYTARVTCFQSIGWNRLSLLLRGFRPRPPPVKVPDDKSPKSLKSVVNEKASDQQYGLASAQPDDKCRVWGVNSLARLPAFGGKATEAAPQQSGYRAPQFVEEEKCAQSGAFLVMSDYDAPVSSPGLQKVETVSGCNKPLPQVAAYTAGLRELRKFRFAKCTVDPDATGALVSNVMGCSVNYELEHGFDRPPPRSRTGGPGATVLHPDVP